MRRPGLTAVVAVLGLAAAGCGRSDRVELRAVAPVTTAAPSPVVGGERDRLPVKSTTTTPVPPRTVTTKASRGGGRYHGNPAGSYNGYPCGGDLPYCWVLERESHGHPTAVNRTGCNGRSCGGLWQFDPRTWAGYGGYRFAQDAPADVQNEKARLTWANGRGCSHWAACG